MTLPERLRELRDGLGLTRAALAAASGVPERAIEAIERAERPRPPFDVFLALASALGVSADELAAPPGTPRGGG